jgi:hypothetical protein
MKVSELIEKLRKFDPDKNVIVSVRASTDRYSRAEVSPFDIDHGFDAATLYVSLPEGLHIQRNRGART